MQQALYRKYRPKSFADLVGQEPIKLTLANQVETQKIGHAYIFAGPKGTGKTTVARILAKAVNCQNPHAGDPCGQCVLCVAGDEGTMLDLIEIDAASHTGVDNIRELISNVYISPTMGKYKVYVIDEAHMLSKGAFNALLKTLEEPPAHAIFILATTEIDKFPATIVSRCQRFDFRPIKLIDIANYLEKVANSEGIDIERSAVDFIAEQSGGGMRDALSLLERAMSLGERVTVQNLSDWFGLMQLAQLIDLTELVVGKKKREAIGMIETAYLDGFDLARVASAWTGVVRQILAVQLGNGADLGLATENLERLQKLATTISVSTTVQWLEWMLELPWKTKNAVVPQLPLELVIIKMIGGEIETTSFKGGDDEGVKDEDRSLQMSEQSVVKEVEPVAEEIAQSVENDVDWERLVGLVKEQSPTLGAVLQSARWQIINDELLIHLTSKFYKDKLEQPTSRQMVVEAMGKCGVELRVSYVLDDSSLKEKAEVDPSLVSEIFG